MTSDPSTFDPPKDLLPSTSYRALKLLSLRGVRSSTVHSALTLGLTLFLSQSLMGALVGVPAFAQSNEPVAGSPEAEGDATYATPLTAFGGTYTRYPGARGSVTIDVDGDSLRATASTGSGGVLERSSDLDFKFVGGGAQSVRFLRAEGEPNSGGGTRIERLEVVGGPSTTTLTKVEVLEAEYRSRAGELRPHALSDAILMGDHESAKKLIAAGADVEEHDARPAIGGRNGRRPLNWAAIKNDVELLELLLESGAGIDLTNEGSGLTALHHAAEVGSENAAKFLVARGADFEAKSKAGLTPMDVALRTGNRNIAELLRAAAERRRCEQGDCSPIQLADTEYQVPEGLDDGLQTASLTKHSEQTSSVARLLSDLERGLYNQVDSLLIMKDGHLVVEQYYGQWDRDRVHMMQSVSKSFTSLLVGSLIHAGLIESVQEPISKYLDEQHRPLLTGEKENLTIEDLLTMSAGFDWNEHDPPYGAEGNIRLAEMASKDAVAFTLSQPFIREPGTVFTYSGGYVTVVGDIIKNAAKVGSVLEAFKKSSLAKLNFENLAWGLQLDGRQNTAGGVLMRPRDLMKVGKLMLDGGLWRGERIVSEDFVRASFAPHVSTPSAWNEYGYFWWGRQLTGDKGTYEVEAAQGWGGQELILIPKLDLIVVMTATNYNTPTPTESILLTSILPAFE